MSFNEKFVCFMPDCIVQQIGISCLRKMNMMTLAVVQSVTIIPSLKMLYLNILNAKTKCLFLIILPSVGGYFKTILKMIEQVTVEKICVINWQFSFYSNRIDVLYYTYYQHMSVFKLFLRNFHVGILFPAVSSTGAKYCVV